ncbi:MAG: PD40 domain-containing protein, partial [Bacteroidales bacterium]|nr:PD40 domain-containing protein [Bacteroidales bacterium]
MNLKQLALTVTVVAAAACQNNQMKPQEGYIGPSDIQVADGRLTPEVLLAFGRLSDPQLSPDKKTILYGVSYTDIASNRSVRNLFTVPVEGGDPTQLTMDGKSLSCARWSPDGKSFFFLQGGKLFEAPYTDGKLGRRTLKADVPGGMEEFALSPDGGQLMYVANVHSAVEVPSDTDPMLDKAQAYATEDLMYRHWDHWVTEIPHTYVATLGNGLITSGMDILGSEDVKFQLPNGPFPDITDLTWSPDGRFIAYACKKLEGKQYAFSTNTC